MAPELPCPSLISLSSPCTSSQVLPCWLLLFAVVFLFLLKLFQIAVPGIVWGRRNTTLMDHIVGPLLAARHFYCEFRHH